MRKKVDSWERLSVSIPGSIATKVRVLLTDPYTTRVPYGAWSTLFTQLLKEWLEKQQPENPPTKEKDSA